MTPEEKEYFDKVNSKFNELKGILENPPPSLQPKDPDALSNAKSQLKQVGDKLESLKAGASVGAVSGAISGVAIGAGIFGPFGALAGAIIGAISGGLIGAAVGYYLVDVVALLAKVDIDWRTAYGLVN